MAGAEITVMLISIHALREEGDRSTALGLSSRCGISIHALREEGDAWLWRRGS